MMKAPTSHNSHLTARAVVGRVVSGTFYFGYWFSRLRA